jgi:hypothetical protein
VRVPEGEVGRLLRERLGGRLEMTGAFLELVEGAVEFAGTGGAMMSPGKGLDEGRLKAVLEEVREIKKGQNVL